jgi:DNA-binding MurR/RpiR family transcriptional regulator
MFHETGSVEDIQRPGRPVSACPSENVSRISTALADTGATSTRRLSAQLGMSRSSLLRLLHHMGLRPFHPRLVHALNEDDYDRRLEFCENFLEMMNDDDTLIDRIFWSDEAIMVM